MSPGQDKSMGGRIGFRVPSNVNTAYEQVANERSYAAGPHTTVNKSDVLREALVWYLTHLNDADELPEETRDLLDEDLIANAGSGEVDA